jgi:hypothetical protein
MATLPSASSDLWPALPLEAWKPTYHNLHMWTQIVGKIQLAMTPKLNHWWNVALQVTTRGLSTDPLGYGRDVFTIQFDFLDHRLVVDRCDGERKSFALQPRTVAEFYSELMSLLRTFDIEVSIFAKPVEVPDPVAFAQDQLYRAYDAEAAQRCWRILLSCDSVFQQFRAKFLGKSSPVHFFWGSFDLAVTRFSGRRAPDRPEWDPITREAYSHEVISAGWWPGGPGMDGPAFYAYAAPEPSGFAEQQVRPSEAFYHRELKEFILMYDEVRRSQHPEQELLRFLESTYDAGATLGQWDRGQLEVRQIA